MLSCRLELVLTQSSLGTGQVIIGQADITCGSAIKLMVSLIADAIVEAKGGVLENAYQEDETEGDITMEDVIINVEQQAAEYERKRRQK